MVALADIGSPSDAGVSVTLRGHKVPVTGVGLRGLISLIARFREFEVLLQGRDIDITPARLLELAPEAVAALIAAGLGSPGDEAAEAVADSLPIAEQLECIEKILDVTMPNGIGPFVERLSALVGRLDAGIDVSTKVPGTKSPRQQKT